jgi:geranylgeranyl reductase family protein
MSGQTVYDVIIAGGGPAGSTAGYILSKAGLKTLIIDKSKFPRKKLCGGLITYKTIRLLERVFGETASSLDEQGIINFESNRYEIRNKQNIILKGTASIPLRFVERYDYDNFLLHKALNSGTNIIEGDRIVSIDILKGMVVTLSGHKFEAKIIIGADGVNSTVRNNFPVDLFGREDWKGNVASAHEIFVNRDNTGIQFTHPVIFFGFIDWGYAWIFPGQSKLKVGICGLKNKNNKKLLSSFRDFLSTVGFTGMDNQIISSYVVPYGSFLPSPIFRNVLLVGDAAGFADPLFGEGIFFAQRSAELAARAVLDFIRKDISLPLLKQSYLDSLQKNIYTEFIYAEKIRDTMFKYLNKFGWYPLKILLRLYGDKPIEAIHGIRSYKWMKMLTQI